MSRTKKIIDDSTMGKACEKYSDRVFSQVDEDKMIDDIMEIIDNQATPGKIADITQAKPIRKNNKYFAPIIAVAASAMIIAVAVTGGLMNVIEPMTHNTNTGVQSTVGAENPNTDKGKVVENVVTPTGDSVEITKERKYQNNVNEIDAGHIALSGGKQKTNYTNPTKITLKDADIKKGNSNWAIKDYESGKVIYSGKGTTITTQLSKMIKKSENGNYTVTFSYVDNENNKIEVHNVFSIEVTKST